MSRSIGRNLVIGSGPRIDTPLLRGRPAARQPESPTGCQAASWRRRSGSKASGRSGSWRCSRTGYGSDMAERHTKYRRRGRSRRSTSRPPSSLAGARCSGRQGSSGSALGPSTGVWRREARPVVESNAFTDALHEALGENP
jgi:hypothetical protein